MDSNHRRFLIRVSSRGASVAQSPASVGMCLEDALFKSVIAGRIANSGPLPELTVAPHWASEGPPLVERIDIELAGEILASYGVDLFSTQARIFIASLLAEKKLVNGQVVEWEVLADETQKGRSRFKSRATRAPYPLVYSPLPEAREGAIAVKVEPQVLKEVAEELQAHPCAESAGLLTGFLLHDRKRKAVSLLINRQIPVEAGKGGTSSRHFSFDPATFLQAPRLVHELEGRPVVGGWWHTHPPCPHCPRVAQCRVDTVFFSGADFRVHASAFTEPYMVALVGGKLGNSGRDKPGFRLYGWDRGVITELPWSSAPLLDQAPGTPRAHCQDKPGARSRKA